MKNRKLYLQVINALTSSLVWLILSSIMIQVIFRYVIRKPLIWPEELARYMMIWMVFSGSILLVENKKHVRIDYFVQFLPQWAQNLIALLIDVIISLSLIGLLIGTWTPLQNFLYLKSPAIRLPLIFVYVIVPISSLFMLCLYLKTLFIDLKNLGSSFGKER